MKHVVNNHLYQTISPADILSFDKALHLRTYEEVLQDAQNMGKGVWKYYKPINVGNDIYYVHSVEVERFGVQLPEFKPKPKETDTTNPGSNYYLSKRFSFVDAFNEMAREHGDVEIKAKEGV